jgi:predicted Zn-dependent protease with MMP-like domain
MPPEEFEALVEKALEDLPEEFVEFLDNVVVMVEDEPSEEDLEGMEPGEAPLGIYYGTNILERETQLFGNLPDRIVIFRGPILRICETRRDVIREVRDTVVHELGHYFGMEEDQMPY